MVKKIKILVISGGGIYGLIPCRFLKEIDNEDLLKIDIIAGTSVGGILALYLTYKMNASSLYFDFKQAIPNIFKTSFWRKINPFSPKYSGKNIERVLREILPSTVDHCKTHFVVPCLGLKDEIPIVFHNFDETYSHIDLWKIGRATSAAPLYFPPFSENVLIDGGVLENIPIITSSAMACKYLNIKISDIDIFVIGTGNLDVDHSKTNESVSKYSVIEWANCLMPILITKGNEMMSEFWGRYLGFNSFNMFNPISIDGKIDNIYSVTSGKLENKCEIYIGDFKKQWNDFINK